jgi:hypothetical protein
MNLIAYTETFFSSQACNIRLLSQYLYIVITIISEAKRWDFCSSNCDTITNTKNSF